MDENIADYPRTRNKEQSSSSNFLSLGILTHLKTVFPSEDVLENQVRSLTTSSGSDSLTIRDVFVYYDTIGLPDNYLNFDEPQKDVTNVRNANVNGILNSWMKFSKKMEQLRSKGIVANYIPLKRNSTVPAAMGSRDDALKDSAMYAIYQYLIEDCQSEYCAFLTHDIMAHGGGGLQHAVHALENDTSLVFAIPPLAAQRPNWNTENDRNLRRLFERFDGTKPYHATLGVINQYPPSNATDVKCTKIATELSTRYLVASKERFQKSIPFTPVPEKDTYFEQHQGASKVTVSVTCSLGFGYLVHPPPWHHGKRLFESCGNVSTLQKVVDNPNYLVVDHYNNMILENWTAACHSIANRTQAASAEISHAESSLSRIRTIAVPRQSESPSHIQPNRVRVLALCACLRDRPKPKYIRDVAYDPLDVALKKLSELVPEIEYIGMHQILEIKGEKGSSSSSSSCEDYVEQYLSKRLIEERQAVVEMIYTPRYEEMCRVKSRPLNEDLVGLSATVAATTNRAVGSLQNNDTAKSKWVGGLHVPAGFDSMVPKTTTTTHNKRHLFGWGEVFHSKDLRCNPRNINYYNTINTYRSRGLTPRQEEDCVVVHYPNILRWAEAIRLRRVEERRSPPDESVLSMLTRGRSIDKAKESLQTKQQFCLLVTITTFQPFYSVDALVRHALCRLLSKQYKPCLALHSWKGGMKQHNISIKTNGPDDTYKLQGQHKFVITMPNELSEGYLMEKTIHPYLAGSVAITASPKVGTYVNSLGMVTCHVSPQEISRVQKYYKGDFRWMPFNTTPDMWNSDDDGSGKKAVEPIRYDPYDNEGKGDEPVLEFVASQWEKELQPCIDEIIRLDRNDDAYIEKLMQPYLLNDGKQSMFDGTHVALSMLHWYLLARSPLVAGLEVKIDSLEGMLEQTPGFGVP